MSKWEKILDDIAQLAGGAAGLVHDAKTQTQHVVRTGIDALAHDLDLVPRDEFEKLETMLVTAREEQEQLKARIDAIEAMLKTKN